MAERFKTRARIVNGFLHFDIDSSVGGGSYSLNVSELNDKWMTFDYIIGD